MRRTLIAALFVVAAACDSSRNPVAPLAGSPLSDVSGTWTGSIRYDYPDDWCTCCIPGYQASATFTQDGSQVKGQIHSACFDEDFAGTLQNGQLSGTAKVSDSVAVYNGRATGSATTGLFLLSATNLGKDNGGEISGYTITFTR